MRVEDSSSVSEFGFSFNIKDMDSYKEVASLMSERIVERNFETTLFEFTRSQRDGLELLRFEVYRIIKEEKERGRYLISRYRLHSKIVTNPNDIFQHILIFSKKPWGEIVWEEIVSKIK